MGSALRDVRLMAAKDLQIERRSRVVTNQVLPFALVILVLFGFALDADSGTLRQFAPGLFWVTVLLVALLAVSRSVSLEMVGDALQGLRLTGVEPWRIFLGKMVAVTLQLLVVQALLLVGIVVFYDSSIADPALLILASGVASVGIAAAGSLYGVVAVGLGVRETLLPILLLPALLPVLIAATRAFGDALDVAAVNGWAWLGLLFAFAVVYTGVGAALYGAILEDT